MMSRTFGAPLGGTTDGWQYGLESLASSLITPPNFGGSGGSCLPSIVVVALGEPGVPVICWAKAFGPSDTHRRMLDDDRKLATLITMLSYDGGFAVHNTPLNADEFSSRPRLKQHRITAYAFS